MLGAPTNGAVFLKLLPYFHTDAKLPQKSSLGFISEKKTSRGLSDLMQLGREKAG